MTKEERKKKIDEARKKYGRPFITERIMNRPELEKKPVLRTREFPHQERPFNVE